MIADPPRRADGMCALEGCSKPLPTSPPKTMPKALRATFVRELELEVFCSSACCREYHGCALPKTVNGGGWDDPETAARTRAKQLEAGRRSR